jgi:hypothetical protein
MSQKSGIKSSEMKYTCPESAPDQRTIKDHKRNMSEEVWLIRCFPDLRIFFTGLSVVGEVHIQVGSPEEGRE